MQKPIGEGGQALVFPWLYQDQELAVKVARTPEHSARIQAEARALAEVAALDPNSYQYVIQNLRAGETQGLAWLVMPRMQGSLEDFIERDSLYERLLACERASAAIAWLHNQDRLHRDIKPANFLYLGEQVVAGDLGSVRDLSRNSSQSAVHLTRDLSAPELLLPLKTGLTPATDVFSLTATICLLLLQEHPLGLPYRAWTPQAVRLSELVGKRNPSEKDRQDYERLRSLPLSELVQSGVELYSSGLPEQLGSLLRGFGPAGLRLSETLLLGLASSPTARAGVSADRLRQQLAALRAVLTGDSGKAGEPLRRWRSVSVEPPVVWWMRLSGWEAVEREIRAEEDRKEAEKRREEARKVEEARREEESRKEEARKAEEARREEESRKAEARKAEEARREEESRKDAEKRREELRKAEEVRREEEARKAVEEARKIEEARKAVEEVRKVEEARIAEEERKRKRSKVEVPPFADPLKQDEAVRSKVKLSDSYVEVPRFATEPKPPVPAPNTSNLGRVIGIILVGGLLGFALVGGLSSAALVGWYSNTPSEAPTSTPKPTPTPASSLSWKTIPAGTGKIGSDSSVAESDEKPVWYARFTASFQLLATEVTNAQYEAWSGGKSHTRYEGCNRDDCPVVNVSWLDARAFCQSIGGDLPTEVEWEYAARAGTETEYWWGDSESETGNHAWYTSNADNPQPVGKAGHANPWGLYDMSGNVWEWVFDEYNSSAWSAYGGNSVNNPVTILPFGVNTGDSRGNTKNVASSSKRVNRGGSGGNVPRSLRSSNRLRDVAGFENWVLGFRCIRSPGPA